MNPARNPPPISSVLHLASTSPRRRRMLAEHAIPHVVCAPGVDDAELSPGDVGPAQWVASLAHLKARAAWEQLTHAARVHALVLGADTVVVKHGEVIGQPRDAADAERIIRALARGRHSVITGVALLRAGDAASVDSHPERLLLVDEASVEVGEIPEPAIAAYLASGEWRGKAGAYNLVERQDAGWPVRCEGDPTTVMGLPMRRLIPLLRGLGVGGPAARSTAV